MKPRSCVGTFGRASRAQQLCAASAIVLLGFAVWTCQASAARRVPLTLQADVTFPFRSFALTLPAGPPRLLRVTENGRPVAAELTPVLHKRVPFSVALVLDTSLTMTGRPFAAARAAAGTLIERKLARSELALFAFSAHPHLLEDWSTSSSQLASGLTGLRTRYGTAIWNAVMLASSELRRRPGAAKAIVVLTDGRRDTTATPVAAAVRAARQAGARVFVVVAGSGKPAQLRRLRRLSESSGGALLDVHSLRQLRRTFAGLARTFSAQYLLTYTSPLQRQGRLVTVRANLGKGVVGEASYRIPEITAATKKPSFWFTNTGADLFVAGIILGPILLLGILLLLRERPWPERLRLGRRRRDLRA